MGVMNHNAVIATVGYREDEFEAKFDDWLHSRAEDERGLFVRNRRVLANSGLTVVCTPDHSKEGWGESDRGDALRSAFIEWLESFVYDDGSNPWSWVEVGFGEYGKALLRGDPDTVDNNEDRIHLQGSDDQ